MLGCHSPKPGTLLAIGLLALSNTFCGTNAYYSAYSDGHTVSWSFPEAHRPSYAERLSAPGQVARATERIQNGEIPADTVKVVTQLTQAIESLHLLSATNGFFDGSDVHDTLGAESPLGAVLNSLESLSDSGASSGRCVNDTGRLIIGVFQGQGWALKFLDAAGKPGPGLSNFRFNFLGDYDLCRQQAAPPTNESDGFRGNYCTLKVGLGSAGGPANPFALAQWGVCMPDTCTDTENTLFLAEAVQLLGANGSLNVLQAESHTDKREATTATVAAIIIICVISALMIVGTAYDILVLQWPRWRVQWARETEEEGPVNMEHGNGVTDLLGNSSTTSAPLNDDVPLLGKAPPVASPPVATGKLAKVLVAFSVYTNGSKVLNTSQASGSIGCIHGIRFLSMSWVILGHAFAFGIGDLDNFATEIPILLSRWSFDAVANAFVSVDTFFTLSGLLVSYLTVTEMKRKGWKLNWGLFYFHRYWRLTPPYMLSLVLILGLQQYCGQGALWSSVQPTDKESCENNWWTNLLYINNLVHRDKECFGHTWYLANDMQFFLVSPLMIIPFFFSPFFGFASCGIFLLATWITTGVLSTVNNWPATMVSANAGGQNGSYFNDYYIAPWCRIGPYVVGIMTGYMLASKKNKIRLSWQIALIGWLVATATALAALYGLRGDIGGKHPSSVGAAALYNAVARSAWGASVCWVIVACVSGWGGFVNTLLSWSPFVVLGRLTYTAYLVHIAILAIFYGNQETLFHLNALNMAMSFMGLMVATYGISFFVMLALESPMIGLEKVFLPSRRKD